MFPEVLTLNSTNADFKVRLLHVSISSEILSTHIVAESDTMATFTSSARNKASALSIKKNTDAS
jgi:heterodisulfide reductase subunit B